MRTPLLALVVAWCAPLLPNRLHSAIRVIDLLRDSDKWMDRWHKQKLTDNLSADADEMWLNNEIIQRQSAVGVMLVAASLAEQPDVAERLRRFVERQPPEAHWPIIQRLYWQNRGRLSWLDGHAAI